MNERTLTTREHGLGELQDQAPSLVLVFVVLVRHIIEARVLAEERSNLFVLLVCERLWEFRASGVFIVTVCMFLTCRRTSSTSTGRRWLFSPCFTWFPALGLLLLSWGHILEEKYEYSELRTVLPPWSLWVLWAPPRESWDLYAVRDPEWKIAGSPPDHPLQSLDHPTAPHGWPRGNRPIAARRGPFIGIGGSPFDSPDDIVRSSDGDCRISVRWPADFFCYISDGGPPIAARWSDGVPRAAAGWGKVGRNRPITRQILTAS